MRAWLVAHAQGQRAWAGLRPQWRWALQQAVDTAHAPQETALAPTQSADDEHRSGAILQAGMAEEPHDPPPPSGQRGRQTQSTSPHVLDRLAQSRAETLAVMLDCAVPFDHHVAERELRMLQVTQKVSGCVRTPIGAHAFCRIRRDISTRKTQGHNVIAALKRVLVGAPLEPEVPG